MANKNNLLIDRIKNGEHMTLGEQIKLTIALSTPAILAQLSSIIMQYIDASMVGSLGAHDSAAIGLVSSSAWLLGGLMSAAAMGFTVQVAHHIGANHSGNARDVKRQSLVACLSFSVIIALIGAMFVIVYSAGKSPVSYLPLGEIISGFVMGGMIPLAIVDVLTD